MAVRRGVWVGAALAWPSDTPFPYIHVVDTLALVLVLTADNHEANVMVKAANGEALA